MKNVTNYIFHNSGVKNRKEKRVYIKKYIELHTLTYKPYHTSYTFNKLN